MQVFLIILGVIAAIVVVVLIAKGAAARNRERLAALAQWAALNGFTFYEKDPYDLDSRFNGIGEIGRGHDRYAYELLQISVPVWAFIFRYHFRTTETRTVTSTDSNGNSSTRTETYEEDHYHAYLIIELNAAFPQLIIRPEHWGDKVAGFLGFDDINFESEQFSRRYFVKSKDRQFAYAVIHPQMIEWMMDRKFVGQLEQGKFALELARNNKFTVGMVQDAWEQAVGFINRIPPFVWQDYGKHERIELPEPRPLPQPINAS
jgi:hypothetical protein